MEENEQAPELDKTDFTPKKNRQLWLSLSVIIILLVGASCAYIFVQHYTDLQAQNTVLTKNIQNAENSIASLKKQTSREIQKQQEELSRFQQSLRKIQHQGSSTTQDWHQDEALYFIRMANYNLSFSRNAPMAIKLLTLADESLQQSTSAEALTLRQSISDDLATLATVPYVDLETIYLRLGTLAKQATSLPIKQLPKDKQPTAVKHENAPWWQALKNSLHTLHSLIVIRRHDDFSNTRLQPEAITRLYENIQLHFTSAQVALLQKNDVIYEQALRQINEWVNTYFDTTDTKTINFIAELMRLYNININPHLPSIDVPEKNQYHSDKTLSAPQNIMPEINKQKPELTTDNSAPTENRMIKL